MFSTNEKRKARGPLKIQRHVPLNSQTVVWAVISFFLSRESPELNRENPLSPIRAAMLIVKERGHQLLPQFVFKKRLFAKQIPID